jgi:hypothetical protein
MRRLLAVYFCFQPRGLEQRSRIARRAGALPGNTSTSMSYRETVLLLIQKSQTQCHQHWVS